METGGGDSISIVEHRKPVAIGTFIEMFFELVKATLLQANFQVDPMASGGRSRS